MDPNIPDPEILFSCDCNPGVLYTHSPCLRVRGSALEIRSFEGKAPENFFWDVCWPTVLWTHGIGLIVVFSHGISPIKESIVTRLCMILFCIVNNLCDCVGETMRAGRGSAAVLLQAISLHFLDCNKSTDNFFVDVAHHLGEPHYIYVSL